MCVLTGERGKARCVGRKREKKDGRMCQRKEREGETERERDGAAGGQKSADKPNIAAACDD